MCVLSGMLLAVYYSSGLLRTVDIFRHTIYDDAGKQMLGKLVNKTPNSEEISFDDFKKLLWEDQAIPKHTPLQAQDNSSASKKLSWTAQTMVKPDSFVLAETPTTDIPEQLQVLDILSKEERLHSEQILRDTINNHHTENFITPKNESCKKRLPGCIVIGVYKCGTREIVDFLKLHPHIQIYPESLGIYEMPYFLFPSVYNRGENWFKSRMPCTYSNQITVIKNGGYFHDKVTPERIKKFNESIKLILMVREPFSRSLSQYMFRKSRYQQKSNNTGKYVSRNFSSFVLRRGEVNKQDFFVRYSVYDEPMIRWLNYFNLNQFLIINSDEFKHDPVTVLTKVERFLGIGHYITPDMFILNKEKGFYCIQSNLTDTGMACYPQNRGKSKQITVSPETEFKLKEYFKPKNKRFYDIIGKSFDWK